MLIISNSPNFLWDEAVATACFTQNRSLIQTHYQKTSYELIRERKPNVHFFYVFGSLCYPTNDKDDLEKLKPKANIGIFIRYPEDLRDLDDLFGPMYEEYYEKRTLTVSTDFTAPDTIHNDDTPSPTTIIIAEDEAPHIVSTTTDQTPS
ncbi:retrovirus-related pol polyprotein from transposon TNT 1-94 [Tanacetum coccineum]